MDLIYRLKIYAELKVKKSIRKLSQKPMEFDHLGDKKEMQINGGILIKEYGYHQSWIRML